MFNIFAIIISILMVFAYVVADHLKPTEYMSELKGEGGLKDIIPNKVGLWHSYENQIALIRANDLEDSLNTIYSDMLERTYENKTHDKLFLSLAYGADQSGDKNQVHRPEFCYPAQGFQISHVGDEGIVLPSGQSLLVRRLLAKAPGRIEPITYWIVIGEKATLPGFKRKLIQFEYGLSGKIPDGLLFRLSSITNEVDKAYALHDDFILELFKSMDTQVRKNVFGTSLESNEK